MTSHAVPKPIELVFSVADGVPVAMDVYVPEKATREKAVPILLWWHAAAPHTLRAPEKHNLCVVSVDYRLAPQTRLPGVLADCKAAIDFLHSNEFAKATENKVDSSRIVVSGSSAGGWLALLAGTGIGFAASGVEPPTGITGVAAIYPITDLLDPFWLTKQRPVGYLGRIIEDHEMAQFVDPKSEKTSWAEATGKRSLFYTYMLQEAILNQLLLDDTGILPMEYSIAQNIRAGKALALPPTYIITGNSDTKVPHRQSLDVVAAYQSVGSNVEYQELEGLDHRFDDDEKEQMESILACTDDGYTARSLSLVSRYFSQISLPFQYQSVCVSKPPQIHSLANKLRNIPSHLCRIRHLFISDDGCGGDRDLASSIIAVLTLAAPTLETLTLVATSPQTSTSLIARLFRIRFPRLYELTVSGHYPFPSTPSCFPSLERLHLCGNRNPHGLLSLGGLETVMPRLAHLRVSGLNVAVSFSQEVQEALMPSDDDDDSCLFPAKLPPRLQKLLVQCGPELSSARPHAAARLKDETMLKNFEALEGSSRFTLLPRSTGGLTSDALQAQWADRLRGKEGGWSLT
ncbi:hypothetical protein NP233_g12478 [Leucocoprinus birnbaumii]|uniref:Alpha/beta hydrolase fold-3 domain-containing protein n=1 Tax=Leucocoprinus birnbaumii TaxID=56174 RepID=A0AAD5YJE5_9AGAR|nr:hypothetical protein NP233_g12478 [Leucocoprinus birnbaumii]